MTYCEQCHKELTKFEEVESCFNAKMPLCTEDLASFNEMMRMRKEGESLQIREQVQPYVR